MDDLWPDDLMDSLDKVKTPISILREQASLLGTKTGNLIEGKVYTASWEDQKDYPFQYGFYLEAPTLENYRFTMFYLFYDIELYPLIMFLDEDIFGEIDVQGLAQVVGTKRLSIDSQDNFIKTLTMIFRSKKLKKLIGALLSQME